MVPTLPDPGLTDAELLRRVVDRDHEAFLLLYDRLAARVFGVIRRVLRDPHDAEDVLQLVMQELWTRGAERYDARLGAVDAWIFRRARSRAIDRARANARRGHAEQRVAPVGDAPVNALRDGLHEELRTALDALGPDLSAPVLLAFRGGMTRDEIATHLDIPVGTVKTRIRRGIAEMRTSLSGSEVGASP